MARTGRRSTAKPFRVLLPASPEALVAAKCNPDIGKGVPYRTRTVVAMGSIHRPALPA